MRSLLVARARKLTLSNASSSTSQARVCALEPPSRLAELACALPTLPLAALTDCAAALAEGGYRVDASTGLSAAGGEAKLGELLAGPGVELTLPLREGLRPRLPALASSLESICTLKLLLESSGLTLDVETLASAPRDSTMAERVLRTNCVRVMRS